MCIRDRISANQVEVIFNREVRDLDELRTASNWEIVWEKDGETIVFKGCLLYTSRCV